MRANAPNNSPCPCPIPETGAASRRGWRRSSPTKRRCLAWRAQRATASAHDQRRRYATRGSATAASAGRDRSLLVMLREARRGKARAVNACASPATEGHIGASRVSPPQPRPACTEPRLLFEPSARFPCRLPRRVYLSPSHQLRLSTRLGCRARAAGQHELRQERAASRAGVGGLPSRLHWRCHSHRHCLAQRRQQ